MNIYIRKKSKFDFNLILMTFSVNDVKVPFDMKKKSYIHKTTIQLKLLLNFYFYLSFQIYINKKIFFKHLTN